MYANHYANRSYLGATMEAERNVSGTAPDNSRVRAAMAAYVLDPTTKHGDDLLMTMMLENFVVLVPMAAEPDGSFAFVTTVMGKPHPILHVFSALEEMPPLDDNVIVYPYPYAELIMEMLEGEDRWNGLVIDPKAAHSVTEYFPITGGHAPYSTAELRQAAGGLDHALN